jgi:hypothetical protein
MEGLRRLDLGCGWQPIPRKRVDYFEAKLDNFGAARVELEHLAVNESDPAPAERLRKRHLQAGRIPPAEDHPG